MNVNPVVETVCMFIRLYKAVWFSYEDDRKVKVKKRFVFIGLLLVYAKC